MATVEVTRDHPPTPLAPVDESVKIPDSVKRAADRANSFYTKPAAEPVIPPVVVPPATPEIPVVPAVSAIPEPVIPPVAPPAPLPVTPVVPPADDSTWEHKYNSMKGRWDASQRTIGVMQEQMQQLGDELMRTQQLLGHGNQNLETPPKPGQKLITAEDEATYGSDIIDLAKRAAQDAFLPELTAIKHENENLKQRMARNARIELYQKLEQNVPNWAEINKNPKWHSWLRLPDLYSRRIRQDLLNEAFTAGDPSRVTAFFKGFIADEVATGSLVDPVAPPAAAAPAPAPRVAAVPLENLTAPGRAKPASGDGTVPVDKPSFTRAQIAAFYTQVRQRVFVGREVEKERLEQQIFAAQREGRVSG